MNKNEINITESTEEESEWVHIQMAEYIRQQLSFQGKLEVPKSYVIKENGTIIAGIKTCFYLEEGLAIDNLFVHEDYRHKGLGSLLLKKVEDEAKSLGA
jgi:GNAT superfamily N-acetyltransferase